MGIAKAQPKATWLKLSAGEGGTGNLFYSIVKGVDANGKKVYEDVQCPGGLENVYFTGCRFHLEEGKDGKPPTKKLQATFVDAVDESTFIISTGWATSLSRYIVYNCTHNDIDPMKPFTVVKTFLGKTAMANGFKPVVPLMSQVSNPRAGDYLKNFLSLHIEEGLLQKTVTITDRSTGRSYQDYDWATILDPLVEPLDKLLKAADVARRHSQQAQYSSGYTESADEGDYYEESYEANEEEVDTSFFNTFNAAPIVSPQPTVVDELAPFFDKLDWGDAEKTAFYSKYGASNTPSLIVTGKLEAAKEYLNKMEEIYAISATLLPAMGVTPEDRDAISKMAAFVASKGVLGLNIIDATLQKAKDLKATQVDPFAEEPKVIADIPF